MIKKNLLLIGLFIFIVFFSKASDTIRVMHYNILYYGVNTSWCTTENNNIVTKDESLSTIIDFVSPDIFTVNEIAADTNVANHLLNNVLNKENELYKRGTLTNFSNNGYSIIANMLYYKTEKFDLIDYDVVTTATRDINIYKLAHKSSTPNDPVYIYAIIAHLKAGSDSDDEQKRTAMVETLISYLNNIQIEGNVMFMGDFNLYSPGEQAFQILIDTTSNIHFIDPINKIGPWHNNSAYSDYHTQSTHTSSGCASSGGMDDRFDYILINKSIKSGNNHFKYLENSYKSIGQDGTYFNSSILNATSDTYSENLRQALYNMSDHLPITIDLVIDKDPISKINLKTHDDIANIFIANNNEINIVYKNPRLMSAQIYITDIFGRILYSSKLDDELQLIQKFNVSYLPNGIYFVTLHLGQHKISEKIIKL